jgi:hypothetical protein
MRVGQPIRAQLIYPVYVDNKLILPEKTTVLGDVTSLRSDHARRINARLRADFTPFHIPVVRFTSLVLADGTTLPITTGTATDGAPIYRLVAPPKPPGGFIRRQLNSGIQILREQLSVFTAPGKKDRFLRLLYSQLPYHPERIESGTAWTVETATPVDLPPDAVTPIAPAPALPRPPDSSTWIIQAYLNEQLSSASSKAGQVIQATVAEPIYNPDHSIAIPQGATLIGSVAQAKPARRFARDGTLHFDFHQLLFPTGRTQTVQASVTGADSSSHQNLKMNSEGQVKPKSQDKIVVPLLLMALAASPLHEDSDDTGLTLLRKNTTASNSIGIIGFIVGAASGSANVAAGFGFYGAALSLYNRWIKRGSDVNFARDTRIVVQTTPRNAAILKPNPAQ